MQENRRWWIAASLSGLLLGATTIGNGPFFHVHWAIFFGFLPLWRLWMRCHRPREIFLSGWLCQFVLSLTAFHWVAYTVNEFGHLGLPLSVLVMLAYSAVANLQIPLAGWLWNRCLRKGLPEGLQVAALALLTALGMRVGTTIFNWNFGYAWLYMGWPAAQTAELFGFRGLCSLSIGLNGLLLLAWLRRKNGAWLRPVLAACGVFGALNLWGLWLAWRLPPPDGLARVLAVQPNIGNREKERLDSDKNFSSVALGRNFRLTEAALAALKAPPDFAVWPENAFPGYMVDPDLSFREARELKKFLQQNRLRLLTGGYGVNARAQMLNALFPIDESGRWSSEPYYKLTLLPFGEFIPGAERFPVLKKLLPGVRDYGRGEHPLLLSLAGVRIGPSICYEGLFDFIARDLANLGAQIIVNVTNDSWYGNWLEPWQHFHVTMAKSVETRRPLIRVTNTGVSAFADARGRLSPLSPVGEEWHSLLEVPYSRNPPRTLFMGPGYWIDWCVLLSGLLLLAAFRRARSPSATPPSGGSGAGS